jgi:hypothetical protein
MSRSNAASSGLTPEQIREVIARLSSPDGVDSPFGRLESFDGLLRPDTVSTVHDALNLMRGRQPRSIAARSPT